MSSLKDLARECGVSVATVSKALNGQSDISAATRDRVREAARRMGYVPNMAARAMKTNRTYNLGVLFVDERQSGLAHEYFSAVLDSFKVQVEKLGYDITFVNRNLGGRTMTYLEHCHYRGVDGAVIACVDFNDPQVVELVNSDVPVVTIDHVFNNRMAVLSDNVNGLSALVRYAYANGHRRIAFIHGERTAVTENRLAGFYKSCAELGLQVPEEYVRSGVYHDPDRCAEETVVLLSKGEVDSKKIRVEFSLEDMDMSEFQDGATYTQIKDYVLEHSGLKVSNLYISQIKRKCGIEVGKNYNLPKSEDSRQPQCPPEKEKAIREAFKYFGMI